MKLALWLGGILVIVGLVGGFVMMHTTAPSTTPTRVTAPTPSYVVRLDGARVNVTLAQTQAQEELGLGDRDSLAAGQGMLFVFAQDGKYAFWMKDMRFSIDIIWFAADGEVVYIAP